MHDGLELESRGVPAAVICTEPFRATAQAICEVRGQPQYPFVVIDHPVGSLSEDELQQRAREIVEQVAGLLAQC